ncbi:MAG TPA: DUF3426 domain-containing protein [Gammaproteobacteria bacterium]
MFTRCPTCHTLFRIQPQQLKAARGKARCGSCQVVFDALEFLVNQEELSKAELSALAQANADARQQQLPFDDSITPAQRSDSPQQPMVPAAEPTPAPQENAAGNTVSIEMDNAKSAPEPVAPTEPPPPPAEEPLTDNNPAPLRYSLHANEAEHAPHGVARLGWGLGSLLLILLLAGQLAFTQRNTLAHDLRWRPWLEQLCDIAGCTLPALRDTGAIEMVDRNVQSHPEYLNALAITATLVNQAPFAQPYPEVELAMTDLDQRRLAARRFKPAEYLEHGGQEGLIPPGASVHLKLEIADPGQEAVGFEFSFH